MFRPYSLTSLAAWTVGSLAGNRAYYSTREKQEIERFAGHLADEYLQFYKKWGGTLDVTSWLEEKERSVNLTSQEVVKRTIILEFQARKLPLVEVPSFVMGHLNIFLSTTSLQYLAVSKRPFDWLDDETLYELWEAFFRQFFVEGLSEEEAFTETNLFLGVKMGVPRFTDFRYYLMKRLQAHPINIGTPPPTTSNDIEFHCEKCGQKLSIDSSWRDSIVECPVCKRNTAVS